MVMKFHIIHLIYFLILFSSCNIQNTSSNLEDTKIQNSSSEIGTFVPKINGNPNVIFQDSKNNYWLAVKEQGAYKYDGENLVFYSKKDGLSSNDILGIQEDNFGSIYFDSFEGVSKFDGQKFTTLELIPSDSSKNEWKLEPNDLWFRMGWNENGPFRYDGKFLYELEFPKTEQEDIFYARYPNVSFNPYGVYSIYQDSKGFLWFGTSSLGVCRYDGKSIRWLYEEEMTMIPGGGALGIRSTLEDKDGYFWFTNTRYCYGILPGDPESGKASRIHYKKKNGLGYIKENNEIDYPYFMSIAEGNNGDLWMATYDDGVWQNNGEKLIHYPIRNGDKTILIFSIYKDKQGMLWLVTNNDGIYKYNGTGFEKYEF